MIFSESGHLPELGTPDWHAPCGDARWNKHFEHPTLPGVTITSVYHNGCNGFSWRASYPGIGTISWSCSKFYGFLANLGEFKDDDGISHHLSEVNAPREPLGYHALDAFEDWYRARS